MKTFNTDFINRENLKCVNILIMNTIETKIINILKPNK